jgi:hypothetical protein
MNLNNLSILAIPIIFAIGVTIFTIMLHREFTKEENTNDLPIDPEAKK